MASTHGQLVILSGPSGVGKTTIVKRLLRDCPLPLVLSVSATTRAPRTGEQDGVDYYFLSREQFMQRQEAGEFLECCEVYGRGEWYGTLNSEVDASVESGKWVILEIDVEGAMKVIDQRSAISIFIQPENRDDLQRRLAGRKTESEERMKHRLARAEHEFSYANRYEHQVTNCDLDNTVATICNILQSRVTWRP